MSPPAREGRTPMPTMTRHPAPRAAGGAGSAAAVRDDQLPARPPCAALSVAAVLPPLVTLTVAFGGAAEKQPQGPGPPPDASRLPADWRERLPRQLDEL